MAKAESPQFQFSRNVLIYFQAVSEKNTASMELEACQRRLGLANRLIAALASEGERWEATMAKLEKDYKVASWH
jgi:dynein heavy chain